MTLKHEAQGVSRPLEPFGEVVLHIASPVADAMNADSLSVDPKLASLHSIAAEDRKKLVAAVGLEPTTRGL